MKKDKDRQFQGSFAGAFGVLAISVLLLVIGGTQLFYPRFQLIYFIRILGALLCVFGVWMSGSYFSRQLYRRLSNYDFSAGILFAISGILVLIRAGEITKHMPLLLGAICLFIGVILLQNALQVRILKGKIWGMILLFSILTLAASVLLILNPSQILSVKGMALFIILMVIGAVTLIAQLCAAYYTRRLRKDEQRKQDRNMEELDEMDRAPEETVVIPPSEVFGTANLHPAATEAAAAEPADPGPAAVLLAQTDPSADHPADPAEDVSHTEE